MELNIEINPTHKQELAWKKLEDHTTNEIFFGGGAGGGKTRLGCEWLAKSCIIYPGSRWLMGRAVLKNLKESTLLTFFQVTDEWGLSRLIKYNSNEGVVSFPTFGNSQIYLRDLFLYPSDPNFDSLGSTEYTGGFIDEANQIKDRAKDVVLTRLRYKLDEWGLVPKLLITSNPSKDWPYKEFYKPAKEGTLDKDKAFIQALVTDNPHVSKSYIEQLKKIKNRAIRERLLNGNWEYDDNDNTLMQYEKILDIFSNHIEDQDQYYITCDVARLGLNRTVIYVWRGLQVVAIKVYQVSRTTEVENEINSLREAYKVPLSNTMVDEDGVGGGVVDHLKCKGFVGGSSALGKMNYINLRSQCYYTLADYINENKIAVKTEVQEYEQALIEELEQIRAKDVDKDGKLKIISKDEIKDSLAGRSPDFADCLMMRMYFELENTPNPNITWF